MPPKPVETAAWSRPARVAASLAIVVYLAAVIAPPLAGPPPASELATALIQPLRPLVGALSLGHGYRFFAPNPGPGHSLRWRLTRADGTVVQGSLPDAAADRPRLLYHRRFMVSEKIAPLVPPLDAPAEVRQRARGDWLPLVQGVAGQLLTRHGGELVEIDLVEHHLPGPEEFLAAAPPAARVGGDVVTPLGSFAWQQGVGR
ncbi:MAG: hypothetical protein ACOYK7_01750 [Pirellulales bacterium]